VTITFWNALLGEVKNHVELHLASQNTCATIMHPVSKTSHLGQFVFWPPLSIDSLPGNLLTI